MAIVLRLVLVGIAMTVLITPFCPTVMCRFYIAKIEIKAGCDEVMDTLAPDLAESGFELMGRRKNGAWWQGRQGRLTVMVSTEDGSVNVVLTGRQPAFKEFRPVLEEFLISDFGEGRVTSERNWWQWITSLSGRTHSSRSTEA